MEHQTIATGAEHRIVGAGAERHNVGAGAEHLVVPAGTRRDKVLVVGIDGLRWDRIAAADAPCLGGMIADGLFAPSLLDVTAGAETVSASGWSTMATGVWPDRHGVRDNTFAGARYDQYPDFLTMMKRADPTVSTFAALDWPPLAEQGTFGSAIDLVVLGDGEELGYYTEDARITAISARVLREQHPDAVFVYLGCVDIAGHGWGAASAEYSDAIAAADRWLGELVDAIAGRPTYREENWLILVTTDHGHLDRGGHGGYSEAERSTFVLARGAAVGDGRRDDCTLVDVAATALDHVGVARPPWLVGRDVRVRPTGEATHPVGSTRLA